MKKAFIIMMIAASIVSGCNNRPGKMTESTKKEKKEVCEDDCCKGKDMTSKSSDAAAQASSAPIACSLTTPELQKRRATVLENLRKQIMEKKELPDGYAFKFPGTDKTIDELTEFIKTERACCGFFTFSLSASGDKKEAWLELTGREGVKDFINTELEFY